MHKVSAMILSRMPAIETIIYKNSDKLYAALLRRYNVSSFKELTVKQRVEILEGLNGLRARAARDRNSEHNKQEKAQSDVNGSKQRDNVFDRET